MTETKELRDAGLRQAEILGRRADAGDCCRDPANLITQQSGWKCYLSVCRRCGRRHRRMVAEPGNVLATGRHSG